MSSPEQDRRRYPRITPIRTIQAAIGEQRALVVELSVEGARVAHPDPLPVGTSAVLRFNWDGEEIAYLCHVAWSARDARAAERGRVIYNSGIELLDPIGDSRRALRSLVAQHVERALDEQKANARGLPPMTTTFLKTSARSSGYVRCELLPSGWRKTPTDDPSQPRNGFTISAEEKADQIDLLCSTYLTADIEHRRSIRKMAEMSVAQADGVATRKFEP